MPGYQKIDIRGRLNAKAAKQARAALVQIPGVEGLLETIETDHAYRMAMLQIRLDQYRHDEADLDRMIADLEPA